MELGRKYRTVCLLLTFLFAFLMVNNFGGYSNPDEAVILKNGLILQMDEEISKNSSNPEVISALNWYKANIENSLTPKRYARHSLFRIFGCFVVLLGIVFLRRQKHIGLHLLLAGFIFLLFSGFYSLGFGLISWAFNLFYLVTAVFTLLYFYSKRTQLN